MNDATAEDPASARAQLREELLTDGLVEEVSLSEVDSRVHQLYPTEPLARRLTIVLDTVRGLVLEGLFVLGNLSGAGGRFEAFDEPLEEAMQEIRNAYVVHHKEGLGWAFVIWLQLTDKGRQLALSTEHGRHIAKEAAEERERAREGWRRYYEQKGQQGYRM